MLAVAQPLEQHHFGGHQLGPCRGQAVKSGVTVALGAAYKWSTGSETGSFTVTQAATITGHANMMLLAIPGAHATSPPEAGGAASGTNSNADAGSISASWGTLETLWMTFCGVGETATAGSFQGVIGGPGSGWGDFAETNISADVVGGMDMGISFLQSTTTPQDPAAFNTDTSNARWRAATIGVCFREQLVDCVAESPTDRRVAFEIGRAHV